MKRASRASIRGLFAISAALTVACGGSSSDPDGAPPDAPRPDAATVDAAPPDAGAFDAGPPGDAGPLTACSGAGFVAGGGDSAVVVSALRIAELAEGFDLDGDQTPDNKLSALSSLAQSAIDDAFAAQTLIVVLELFDYPGAGPDACVDVAFYQGAFAGCGMTGEDPCTPYDPDTPNTLDLDLADVGPGGVPVHAFLAGAVSTTADGDQLYASPGTAQLDIPVTTDLVLPIPIAGGILTGHVVAGPDGPHVELGMLGGVMAGRDLDSVDGLQIEEIGLSPDDTLLDAYFANILGPILALPPAPAPWDGCRTPDIDVDGDGLEIFCDSDPLDDVPRVDTCIDGDGTVIVDVVNPDQSITQCAHALDADGNPRFVDGISLALAFESVSARVAAP